MSDNEEEGVVGGGLGRWVFRILGLRNIIECCKIEGFVCN